MTKVFTRGLVTNPFANAISKLFYKGDILLCSWHLRLVVNSAIVTPTLVLAIMLLGLRVALILTRSGVNYFPEKNTIQNTMMQNFIYKYIFSQFSVIMA